MLLEHIVPLSGGESFRLEFREGAQLRCGPQELLDHHLQPGLILEGEALEKLEEACSYYLVRRKAMELASARLLNSGQLQRKLTEKGFDPEHARRAAERLAELGAIDEAAYADMVVRHYARKDYGLTRIRAELQRHLVPRDYWEDALEQLEDPACTLDRLVESRLRDREADEKTLKKLADALCRRGYSWEQVRSALRRWEEAREE